MKIYRLLFSIIVILPLTHVFGQGANPEDIEYEVSDLGHGIYALVARGGTIGLCVGEDGAFLIDAQYAPLAPKLQAAIAELTDQPVRFLLNTHWHGDHTGGNAALAGTGTVVLAHDNVRARMAAPGPRQAPDAALPMVTYSDTTTYHLNGLKIQAFHVEHAHTDGDTVVHFPEVNIIHAGDILFNGIYPYIDLASGGSVDGFIAAMKKVVSLADEETKILGGHGKAVGSRGDVEKSIAMVKATRAIVAKLVAGGMTLEEVQAADPLADFHADWAWAFIDGPRMTEILYQDNSGE
jgi:glyoxylase-like metal-dependent hydrolase (beta-lactamase superfamily II)